MTGFGENVKKTIFDTYHLQPPDQYFFQNSSHLTFFTLLTPNFMQSVSQKVLSSLWDIQARI